VADEAVHDVEYGVVNRLVFVLLMLCSKTVEEIENLNLRPTLIAQGNGQVIQTVRPVAGLENIAEALDRG
jgi:hypothetical protein